MTLFTDAAAGQPQLLSFRSKWAVPVERISWLPGLALILDLALVVAFLSGDVKSAIYIVAAVCLCVPMTLIANSRRQDMTRNS
jgi:hypothetical protein